MKFILLINVKMTKIYVVVILTFISRIHDKFDDLNPKFQCSSVFDIFKQFKLHAELS